MHDDQLKGVLIVVFGVLILTPDGLLIRLVSVDPWTTMFWRGFLSGNAIFVGYWLISRQNPIQQLSTVGKSGLACGAIFALGSVCFVQSIVNTTVANTLFIASTAPIFAALIARWIMKEEVPRRTWLAITIALAGVAIIAGGSFGNGQASLTGDLYALATAICMASSLSIARHQKARSMVPAMGVSGYILAAVAVFLARPFSPVSDDWLFLALMGLIVVPIPFSMMAIGPRYLPVSEVSLLLLLEAVLGPFWVWLVLKEFPGWWALIGGAIVIVALFAMNIVALRLELRKQ